MGGISLSCELGGDIAIGFANVSFTYLNTAPYALYLLPTYWRYRQGKLNV